jgi:hypothetical protein
MMLIDRKIDVRIWKSEKTMGRNGERVVPESHSIELLELQNFTLKFLSLKSSTMCGIGFEQGLNS